MPHWSQSEIAVADAMQKKGYAAEDVLEHLQVQRNKDGKMGPSKSSVYRFFAGEVYARGAEETRGRPSRVPARLVSVANHERRRLIKDIKNEYLVTWEDVYDATKRTLRNRGVFRRGAKMPSLDWFTRLVRDATSVRARPGKRRLEREKDHKVKRYAKAGAWKARPQNFWLNDIECYIDNKKFVLARTAAQKKRLRSMRITHHLRTPQEGKEEAFILPKKGHLLLGVPSVEITAAVAKDKIFFWHVTEGNWNGAKAAQMYAALGKALHKRYGNRRRYRVVEDGDRKGYQSNRGQIAKKEVKIESWTLPPRTPSWMPLDYCLWDAIENKMLEADVVGDETEELYLARLRRAALTMPPGLINSTILKMKENSQKTYDNKGGHTDLD